MGNIINIIFNAIKYVINFIQEDKDIKEFKKLLFICKNLDEKKTNEILDNFLESLALNHELSINEQIQIEKNIEDLQITITMIIALVEFIDINKNNININNNINILNKMCENIEKNIEKFVFHLGDSNIHNCEDFIDDDDGDNYRNEIYELCETIISYTDIYVIDELYNNIIIKKKLNIKKIYIIYFLI